MVQRHLPVVPLRWVLVREPCNTFQRQAFLCPDLGAGPEQILAWFIPRWQIEVTFEEARAHLGMETQRQWSAPAIARTTPAILGLYLIVLLAANALLAGQTMPPATLPVTPRTAQLFDTIALVRRSYGAHGFFCGSGQQADTVKIPRALFQRLTQTVCYAV